MGGRPITDDPSARAQLKPNPNWAKLPLFNRKNWTRVRFGDVVENLNETCDPAEAGLERVIAMEHLEPGSLHIRAWGKVADGTTFTRRCHPGQVLFGKRRAYQRKVAVAEFDAVVSGDIYVLAPQGDQLLPELLPFLCLSERFFQHAVGTSAGSLSPRTNWSSLASFEFDLPPLDQQCRIAEILWAVDENLQSAIELQFAISTAKDAFFDDELQQSTGKNSETLKRLGNALSGIVAGKSPKSSSNPASNDEFGVLKVSAAGDGVFCEEENKALLDASDFVPSLEVKPGMILVTRCNALLAGIGRACLVEKTRPGLMLCDKTLQLVPNDELVDRDFLLQGLRRDPYRGFVERSANGTEAKNITQETLRAAPFWIPSLSKQRAIVERLRQFAAALIAAQKQRTSLERLRSTFINEVVQ
jgi:type I restriction enzyme S subunit